MSALVAKNIVKHFKYPKKLELLKGINLEVAKGETIAIVGRSGEGKSTLLHILGTLDSPTSGELIISNQLVTTTNLTTIRRHHIGFVFQSFYLMEDYTVLQNVLMPAKIAREPLHQKSAAYQDAIQLLEKVGLSDRMHHFGKQLSGGEKQRVAIARAMCNNPAILFADEPSGNLDRQTSIGIHQLLLQFAKEKHKSLVIVTHDEELATLCDRQYRLNCGLLEAVL